MVLLKTLWTTIQDLVDEGQEISDNFDTAFSNIDDAIDQIDINTAAIAILNNTGLSVMSGNNIAAQPLVSGVATKIVSFDTAVIDVGVGTTPDVANQRMTADVDGVYKLRYESFVSYASNVTITWQVYKNGVAFGNSITLSGQGSGVFPIILISSAELLTGDYLELHGTASANTDLTVSQANGTLEKTHF